MASGDRPFLNPMTDIVASTTHWSMFSSEPCPEGFLEWTDVWRPFRLGSVDVIATDHDDIMDVQYGCMSIVRVRDDIKAVLRIGGFDIPSIVTDYAYPNEFTPDGLGGRHSIARFVVADVRPNFDNGFAFQFYHQCILCGTPNATFFATAALLYSNARQLGYVREWCCLRNAYPREDGHWHAPTPSIHRVLKQWDSKIATTKASSLWEREYLCTTRRSERNTFVVLRLIQHPSMNWTLEIYEGQAPGWEKRLSSSHGLRLGEELARIPPSVHAPVEPASSSSSSSSRKRPRPQEDN
jgi:hypothetical protein